MATFRFARGVNMRWQGNDIQGPAGTIFSISDEYYEEFNNQVGQVEPTLEWLVTDELGAVQAQVAGLPVSASAPISATTTTAGTNISLAVGTAPANYVLASNGAGGASFIAAAGSGVSSLIGTSPISASASTGAVTLSLNASYSTSTHDHSGTYQPSGTYVTAVNGTAPIAASTNTAGVATLSLNANYSTSTHDHSGVYVTSVAGTAPISASTTTAGAATVSVSTGVTSATVALGNHNHTGVYQASGTYVTSVAGDAAVSASGTTAISLAHTTTDAYRHVPATSTINNGKFLKSGATAGSEAWANIAMSDITTGNYLATAVGGTGVTVSGIGSNAATNTISIGQAVSTSSNVTFNQVIASDYIKLSSWNQATAGNDSGADTVTVTTSGTYYAIGGANCEVSFTPDFVGQQFFVTMTGYASLNTTTIQYAFVRVTLTDSANAAVETLGYGRSDNFGTTGRGGTVAFNQIWTADTTSARKIKLYGTTQTTNGLVLSLAYWQINVMALA